MKDGKWNCTDNKCDYFNILMEQNCSYSVDNSKCVKNGKSMSSDAVLDDVALSSQDKYEFLEILRSYFGTPIPDKMYFHFFDEIQKHFNLSRKRNIV